MSEELKQAARVHYSFLPDHYEDEWLEVATRLQPRAILGGDYCSLVPLGRHRFAACITDATGHNLASALYAARINTYVLTNILQGQDPCQLVTGLNRFLCRNLTDSGMYASFFVLYLDAEAGEVQYAGAGHPAALHYSATGGQIHWLESQTTLLGLEYPLPVDCPHRAVPFGQGDRILLYTDGLTEARDSSGSQFGRSGIARYANSNSGTGNDEFVAGLCTTVCDYSQGNLTDDVLCLGIRVKPDGQDGNRANTAG